MIRAEYVQKIAQDLSNHFEIFFWITIGVACVYCLLLILLWLREVNFKDVSRTAVQNFLFSFVTLGVFLLFSTVGYLFWYNYHHPAPVIQFPDEVLADTSWVKNDLRVYFIDGNRLQSVRINGQDKEELLSADAPVKEYQFSPDGKYILVATAREIYLIDRANAQKLLVDSWDNPEDADQWRGAISGIRWAPNSRYFCYEIARWSNYASQNQLHIYDVAKKESRTLQSPVRRFSSLYWDRDSANLYYLQKEAQDTSVHTYAFELNVFRIPLVSLQPEFVSKIPFEEAGIPIANLIVRGINLYLEGDTLVFRQGVTNDLLVSEQGQALGIDEDDHLYFVTRKWFRARLLKIPREARLSDIARHQYQGGDLAITQIRWIPGGRYAIMLHRYFGPLIIEPSTRKIGLFVAARGNALGWYSDQ